MARKRPNEEYNEVPNNKARRIDINEIDTSDDTYITRLSNTNYFKNCFLYSYIQRRNYLIC